MKIHTTASNQDESAEKFGSISDSCLPCNTLLIRDHSDLSFLLLRFCLRLYWPMSPMSSNTKGEQPYSYHVGCLSSMSQRTHSLFSILMATVPNVWDAGLRRCRTVPYFYTHGNVEGPSPPPLLQYRSIFQWHHFSFQLSNFTEQFYIESLN